MKINIAALAVLVTTAAAVPMSAADMIGRQYTTPVETTTSRRKIDDPIIEPKPRPIVEPKPPPIAVPKLPPPIAVPKLPPPIAVPKLPPPIAVPKLPPPIAVPMPPPVIEDILPFPPPLTPPTAKPTREVEPTTTLDNEKFFSWIMSLRSAMTSSSTSVETIIEPSPPLQTPTTTHGVEICKMPTGCRNETTTRTRTATTTTTKNSGLKISTTSLDPVPTMAPTDLYVIEPSIVPTPEPANV